MPWVSSIPFQAGEGNVRVSDEKIRFFWCTDSHAATFGTSYMDNMIAFVNDCNDWRPEFVVHTGDMGSNSVSSVYNVWSVLRRAFRPLVIAIGNHDEEESTLGAGNPNTAPNRAYTMWNQTEPFCSTRQVVSGDGTLRALIIVLDECYYNDTDSPVHEIGDRIGFHADEVIYGGAGGYTRMLGGNQLTWLASVLASNSSDIVLIFLHQRPDALINVSDLADVLQADGRPMALFCGHNHGNATVTAWEGFNYYKCPAMQDTNSWTRVALSLVGGAIQIDEMEIQNYTDPGGWTIAAPFTLAA